MPALAAALMATPRVRFYHDHVLVKEGGTRQRTPWHQDQPYYNVDGRGVSAWIPVDPVPADGCLELVAGSHRGPWLMPRTFMKKEARWFPEGSLAELPDIDADPDRYDIRRYELRPGDAIFFDFLTVHGAPGFAHPGRRRILSLRYLSADGEARPARVAHLAAVRRPARRAAGGRRPGPPAVPRGLRQRLMTDKHQVRLGAVQQTLFIPLAARAAETRRKHPVLRDPKAAEMLASIDYDAARYGRGTGGFVTILRTAIIDFWVRGFLTAHPAATVVELGTGLNTRFDRVDNGQVHWFDLDLPDTIELRRNFFADTGRRRMIAASILDEDWLPAVAQSQGPYFFVADGVLVYLPEDQVMATLTRIAARFPGVLDRAGHLSEADVRPAAPAGRPQGDRRPVGVGLRRSAGTGADRAGGQGVRDDHPAAPGHAGPAALQIPVRHPARRSAPGQGPGHHLVPSQLPGSGRPGRHGAGGRGGLS